MKWKLKTMKYLAILMINISCYPSVNQEVSIEKIFVSYYPSRRNYDFDSIILKNTLPLKVDSVYVSSILNESWLSNQITQKLISANDSVYVNIVHNDPNMPFQWRNMDIDNFSCSIDSIRKYLKLQIIQNNRFGIYSKQYDHQKVILGDTNKIILKELYGGL